MKTDNYEIKFSPSSACCKLTLTNHSLVKSIVHTHVIPGVVEQQQSTITFPARSVQLLSSAPSSKVHQVAKLIRHLSKQMAYLLEQESCTLLGFHPKDVLVVNDSFYVYVGSECVVPYHGVSGMATVTCPFTADDFFLSPEMKTLHQLPAQVHYKTCYFSLGCLVLDTILGNAKHDYATLSHGEILDLISHHPIKNTRIFWLLSRLFLEDAALRSILLI